MSVDVRAGTGALPLPDDVDEVDLVAVRTYWQLVRQRFLRHRLAVIAVVVLAILIVVSIAIPMATGIAYQKSSSRSSTTGRASRRRSATTRSARISSCA